MGKTFWTGTTGRNPKRKDRSDSVRTSKFPPSASVWQGLAPDAVPGTRQTVLCTERTLSSIKPTAGNMDGNYCLESTCGLRGLRSTSPACDKGNRPVGTRGMDTTEGLWEMAPRPRWPYKGAPPPCRNGDGAGWAPGLRRQGGGKFRRAGGKVTPRSLRFLSGTYLRMPSKTEIQWCCF